MCCINIEISLLFVCIFNSRQMGVFRLFKGSVNSVRFRIFLTDLERLIYLPLCCILLRLFLLIPFLLFGFRLFLNLFSLILLNLLSIFVFICIFFFNSRGFLRIMGFSVILFFDRRHSITIKAQKLFLMVFNFGLDLFLLVIRHLILLKFFLQPINFILSRFN